MVILVVVWVGFAAWCARVKDGPRLGEEVETGLAMWLVRVYARVVHRLRVEGAEHLPRGKDAGPLLVVANHTAGIDPILIQAACEFEVSWMMAADMMVHVAEPVWRWTRVIRVERLGEGKAEGGVALREAARRLQAGEVVGVFPEGKIERPSGVLLPFAPGVGMIAMMGGKRGGKRAGESGAQKMTVPVLPVVIRGTPYAKTAWGSWWRRSRSVLRVLPLVRYPLSMSAEEIARDLERRCGEAMGGRSVA